MERRRSRILALEILYELEVAERSLDDALANRAKSGLRAPPAFTLSLVNGVREHQKELDRIISDYTEAWSLERMPPVDRNIVRIALYELFYKVDIPVSVSINEAVEMGKKFGSEDSGKFINGVLGRIAEDFKARIKKSEEARAKGT